MKTKFTIYIILLISTIISLVYLFGISFFMYFGKEEILKLIQQLTTN
jgi:hypothetical protein